MSKGGSNDGYVFRMAGERGEINSAVPPAAQRPEPERRAVDFFLAGVGSGVAGVSS